MLASCRMSSPKSELAHANHGLRGARASARAHGMPRVSSAAHNFAMHVAPDAVGEHACGRQTAGARAPGERRGVVRVEALVHQPRRSRGALERRQAARHLLVGVGGERSHDDGHRPDSVEAHVRPAHALARRPREVPGVGGIRENERCAGHGARGGRRLGRARDGRTGACSAAARWYRACAGSAAGSPKRSPGRGATAARGCSRRPYGLRCRSRPPRRRTRRRRCAATPRAPRGLAQSPPRDCSARSRGRWWVAVGGWRWVARPTPKGGGVRRRRGATARWRWRRARRARCASGRPGRAAASRRRGAARRPPSHWTALGRAARTHLRRSRGARQRGDGVHALGGWRRRAQACRVWWAVMVGWQERFAPSEGRKAERLIPVCRPGWPALCSSVSVGSLVVRLNW